MRSGIISKHIRCRMVTVVSMQALDKFQILIATRYKISVMIAYYITSSQFI